jgi:hypothetical protein
MPDEQFREIGKIVPGTARPQIQESGRGLKKSGSIQGRDIRGEALLQRGGRKALIPATPQEDASVMPEPADHVGRVFQKERLVGGGQIVTFRRHPEVVPNKNSVLVT